MIIISEEDECEEEQTTVPDSKSTTLEKGEINTLGKDAVPFVSSQPAVSQLAVPSVYSATESHVPATTISLSQLNNSYQNANPSTVVSEYESNRNVGHQHGNSHLQNFEGHRAPMTLHPLANPYTTPVFQGQGRRSRFDHARVPSAHATLPLGFNPYPETSELHSNYHNRLVEESNSEIVSRNYSETTAETNLKAVERIVDGVVVRDYEKKVRQVPKFIPRQAISKKRTVNMDADNVPVVKKVKSNAVSNATATNKNSKEASVVKRDKIDEELRRNSFVLGPVAGPRSLPDRKIAKTHDTSIEKSRAEIREKLKKVIICFPPNTKKIQ
jgi:hypothetical protein